MLSPSLSDPEFAEAAGVSRRTVGRWKEAGFIRADESGRIPRAELDRLRAGRESAQERVYVQARAIAALDAAWRDSYRRSVAAIATAGGELRDHLLAEGNTHAADKCQTCADTLDRLLVAEQNARTHAGIATYVGAMHATLRAAAQDADNTRAGLRRDPEEK